LQPSTLCSVLLAALLPAVVMFRGHARPGPSTITIHVHKAGLFSAFGHEHTVTAPIARARVDTKARTVEIVVEAKQMKVVDEDASAKDRVEIQTTMLGPSVLDTDKFPEIRFQSSRVEEIGGNRYRVTGKLNLHGVTKDLRFEVSRNVEGVYEGKTKLKQTDFGIQPVSAAGGTVKVKDELEIEFHIRGEDGERIGASGHRSIGRSDHRVLLDVSR
jgi:polyisoprenoid-binding protein YceI